MGYDFEIQYRLGLENKAADTLSRVTPLVEIANLTLPMVVDVQSIMDQVEADPWLSKLKKELLEDVIARPRIHWIMADYFTKDGWSFHNLPFQFPRSCKSFTVSL